MNITDWNLRNKTPHLPEGFDHQDSKNFTSNWEYCKTLSTYHFDKWREDDNKYYAFLGRFVGNWKQDLEYLKSNAKLKLHKDRPWTGQGENPLLEQEKNDHVIYGGNEDYSPYWHITTAQVKENCPNFLKMVEFFNLKKHTFGVHMQKPGQYLHIHIDKFQQRNPSDTTKIIRLHINLEDYDLSQFIGYGNDIVSHWKAGDIIMEDWANVPHSYHNAGKQPNCWLGITGVVSGDTEEIIRNSFPDARYELRI